MTLFESTNGLTQTGTICKSAEPSNQLANKCYMTRCRKKLKLTDMTCRCSKRFCASHRLPETHACTFDHTAREWSDLVNQLMSYQTDTKKVPAI